MQFPYYFHVFGYTLHPHHVMEFAAYAAGFTLNVLIRRRRHELDTPTAAMANMWHIVGALFGAIAGAKLLAIAEQPYAYAQEARDVGMMAFVEGKTIVGGLLGGWLGVEIAKKLTHTKQSTGDSWVLPILVATAIGRVGCFLTGLSDQTYGIQTSLPWGVDFGDGISRHPTQLYEIAFLLVLAVPMAWLNRRCSAPGVVFRWFILCYCGFRFLVEFIKPTFKPYAGMSAIQVTCLAAVVFCLYNLRKSRRVPGSEGVVAAARASG